MDTGRRRPQLRPHPWIRIELKSTQASGVKQASMINRRDETEPDEVRPFKKMGQNESERNEMIFKRGAKQRWANERHCGEIVHKFSLAKHLKHFSLGGGLTTTKFWSIAFLS